MTLKRASPWGAAGWAMSPGELAWSTLPSEYSPGRCCSELMKFSSCMRWMRSLSICSRWSAFISSKRGLLVLVHELAGLEDLAEGFAQVFQGVLAVELLELGERVLEAGIEQEVAERLHEVVERKLGGEVAVVLGIAGAFHSGSQSASQQVSESAFGPRRLVSRLSERCDYRFNSVLLLMICPAAAGTAYAFARACTSSAKTRPRCS